jgi:hypothetical protein
MPFLTLQNTSNLAQYYNNTVNGTFAGTVNNPNVTFSPKPEVPKSSDQFTLSDEGLIRGGATNVILAVKQDENRVGNFLQSDKGRLWTAKQLGLQRSNPLLEYTVNKNAPGTSKITAEILQSTRLYNVASPINLVASIGGNAFGLHFDRHGLIPVNTYNYEKIATENNKNQITRIDLSSPNKNTNRLVSYLAKILPNYTTGAPTIIQTYSSGPNSPYGLGITRIDTAPTIRTNYLDSFPVSGSMLDELQLATPVANSDLKDGTLYTQLSYSPLKVNKTIAKNYVDIESRIGVSTKKTSDSINVINVTDSVTFYTNSSSGSKASPKTSDGTIAGGTYGRDIIKFRIEFLDNDTPASSTGINTQVLAFRAYLDDFNDGMTAKWDPYRYMGRGEEFYVYNGFTRDISVAFTMYAHSPAEMKPLYNKLNYLMSTFAPDYTEYNKMRGNIGYLTVGDYIYRQPGVFTDIKLSGLLDTHWEIALKENGTIDDTQYEVPKLIKVALSFKPIHTFLPRTGKDVPFVTLDKNAYPVQAGGLVDENGRITKPGTNKYLG